MTRPIHIAVVDDEESIRKALGRLFRSTGLDTEAFASGQSFLDSLPKSRPDCVILDLHMPGLTGLDVLKQMLSAGTNLPTIVITAYDEPWSRDECLAAGAKAFLRKPLDDDLLLETVADAMR